MMLKIYLCVLRYIGIDILDVSIYRIMYNIKELKLELLDSEYDMYDVYIKKISSLKWHGYGYNKDVYYINETAIREYCLRNNIDYVMFLDKYNDDISKITETRFMYKFLMILCDICIYISDSYLFEKYFWYKTYTKEIDNISDFSEIFDKHYSLYLALDEDKSGYLKEYITKSKK